MVCIRVSAPATHLSCLGPDHAHTLGKPPTADALIKASRVLLDMSSFSSGPGGASAAFDPCLRACWYTAGSSSGQFRIESVVAVMRYQVFCGRLGSLRIDERSVGVTMRVSVLIVS